MGFKTWADYNEADYAIAKIQKLKDLKKKHNITKEVGFDAETKTIKEMRIAAYKKYGEPICRNIVGEDVFIGEFPEIQELMKEEMV